jgi:K+-sensing histidine kinase KdpD
VSRAVEAVRSEFPQGSLAVELDDDPSLRAVKLDRDLFAEVMTNLMENAFYRMKEKGEIKITTETNSAYAVVTMTYQVDHISDDDIAHFFYPFVVDYPFAKGKPDAVVMDVPMSRVIVHKHGGIINVSKESDRVVKITISLPLE